MKKLGGSGPLPSGVGSKDSSGLSESGFLDKSPKTPQWKGGSRAPIAPRPTGGCGGQRPPPGLQPAGGLRPEIPCGRHRMGGLAKLQFDV